VDKKPSRIIVRRIENGLATTGKNADIVQRSKDELGVNAPQHDAVAPSGSAQQPAPTVQNIQINIHQAPQAPTSWSYSYRSTRTTTIYNGSQHRPPPSSMPATESGAAHVLGRVVQLLVWGTILIGIVYLVGSNRSWW